MLHFFPDVPHVQTLPLHVSPAEQAVPQPPQFLPSVVTSVHTPKHLVVGAVQIFSHEASVQISSTAHALPHAPQLSWSLVSSTHLEAHVKVPDGQTSVHAPDTHT